MSARGLLALCAVLLAAPIPLHAQSVVPAPAFPAEPLLEALRTRWLHRARIDWATAEPALRATLDTASTDASRAAAFVALFECAGDVHSRFVWQDRAYSHWEGMEEPERQRLLALMPRERATSGRPHGLMLRDHVAYVLVPGMPAGSPGEVRALAESLHAQVGALASKRPRGWIVDLRLNGGGNLYPMLVGLAPLLGDGVVGGTADADRTIVQRWVLRAGALLWRDASGDREFASLGRPQRGSEATKPVAVLLGPLTRSSGQALALAFRGRARTVLMGEPTARGYATVTAPVDVGEGLLLTLTVGGMTGRADRGCDGVVLPDTLVSGRDDFDDPLQDATVQAALEWLGRTSRGGR